MRCCAAMRLTPPAPAALLVGLCLAAACAAPAPPAPATAPAVAAQAPDVAPWPEAAARFRSQGSSWLGADSAYSVDLRSGRVLWLFGDTFVDPARDGSRTDGPNFFL